MRLRLSGIRVRLIAFQQDVLSGQHAVSVDIHVEAIPAPGRYMQNTGSFTIGTVRLFTAKDSGMNRDEMTLRPATLEDVEEIVAFIRELADYEKLAHEMIATEESIRAALFGKHPTAEVVIAEVGDQSVGFALFFGTFSTFLGRPGIWLEDLFVRPAFRGQGIGKALLQYLAGIACDRGYGRLEWSVLDWNEPSIQFYRQMGAVAMHEWTTYRVSGDALLAMARA